VSSIEVALTAVSSVVCSATLVAVVTCEMFTVMPFAGRS